MKGSNFPIVHHEVFMFQLVSEFMQDQRRQMAPATFQMDSLMREMQEIEGARMVPQRGAIYIMILC